MGAGDIAREQQPYLCGTLGAACVAAKTLWLRDKAVQSQGDHEGLWPFFSDSQFRAIGLPV